MKKWFTKKYPPALSPPVAVTALQTGGRGAGWEGALPQPLRPPEAAVYEGLREAVPIVDAALQKIVRLTAGVQVTCSHPAGQRYLDRFIREVPVGAGGTGLETFLSGYLMSLLTYGNAVGEMVPGPEGDEIAALYLSDLGDVELRREESPLAARLLVRGADGLQPVPYPELVFFSALDPAPGEIEACIGWLRNQVAILRPAIIVCIGRVAAVSLIQKDFKVTKQHGQFIEKNGVLMMGTFHPAALLRNPVSKPAAMEDLLGLAAKAKELGLPL